MEPVCKLVVFSIHLLGCPHLSEQHYINTHVSSRFARRWNTLEASLPTLHRSHQSAPWAGGQVLASPVTNVLIS